MLQNKIFIIDAKVNYMKNKTYAKIENKDQLVLQINNLPKISDDEVLIKVINCGICHSDISAIDNAWKLSKFPLVAGHEIIGNVADVGKNVKNHKVGDVVGLGWHSGYCHSCEYCKNDDFNFCVKTKKTIYSQTGGFAEYVKADSTAVIPIPEGMEIDKIGPLLCGGITVFTPIIEFNLKKDDKVGVIGIGGLGHLAIKFLNAIGCEVTAFSTSPEKKNKILSMGANKLIQSNDDEILKQNTDKFDFIISTVNHKLNWNRYLECLKPRGRLHMVGATLDALDVSVFNLMKGRKSISGSPVGSPKNIVKMLQFVKKHRTYPDVEIFSFNEINKAITKLRKNEIRFRAVVKW